MAKAPRSRTPKVTGDDDMGIVEDLGKAAIQTSRQYGLIGVLLVAVLLFLFSCLVWLGTSIAQPWVNQQINLMSHQVQFMDELNKSLQNRQHESELQSKTLEQVGKTLEQVQAAEREKLIAMQSINTSLQENSRILMELRQKVNAKNE